MATTPAKKTAAKRAPAKKAPAKSLPGAAREIEHAVSEALHRELKAVKHLLENVEKDVRSISRRVEATVEQITGKKAPAKKAPAKKAAAKRAPAKKAAGGS